MSVEQARRNLEVAIRIFNRWQEIVPLPSYRDFAALKVDAASIAYDLAVAQACEERARRAVAWA